MDALEEDLIEVDLAEFVVAVGEQSRLTSYGTEQLQQPASPWCIGPVARRQTARA